jgi:hypothetical protein
VYIGEAFNDCGIIETRDTNDLAMHKTGERGPDYVGCLHHRRHLARISANQRVVFGVD